VFEALFTAGAVDVFTQQWDEESRPGFCSPLSAILSNCSVVRLFYSEKPVHWEFVVHPTTHFRAKFKELKLNMVSRQGCLERKRKRRLRVQPEYEDCAQLARNTTSPGVKSTG